MSKRNIIVSIIIIFCIIWSIFAVYGIVQFHTRSDRLSLVESLDAQKANLELQVYELRRINDLSLILEQILNPLQILELRAVNEQIKQKKQRH